MGGGGEVVRHAVRMKVTARLDADIMKFFSFIRLWS